MGEYKIIYCIIVVLMIILALLCPNWNGIFIAEGFLTGLGLVVALQIKDGQSRKG